MVVTLCAAISAGIFLTAIARRLNIPAIILLLFGGMALGPVGLNVVRPESLGAFLPVVIALAVALILFEGGLTLDFRHYRHESKVIRRLLTIGVLVTWLLAASFVWIILSLINTSHFLSFLSILSFSANFCASLSQFFLFIYNTT